MTSFSESELEVRCIKAKYMDWEPLAKRLFHLTSALYEENLSS